MPMEELGGDEGLELEREEEGSIEDVSSIKEGGNQVFKDVTEDVTSAAKKLSLSMQKARKVLMASSSAMSMTLLTQLCSLSASTGLLCYVEG
jgi:hypothetical protein